MQTQDLSYKLNSDSITITGCSGVDFDASVEVFSLENVYTPEPVLGDGLILLGKAYERAERQPVQAQLDAAHGSVEPRGNIEALAPRQSDYIKRTYGLTEYEDSPIAPSWLKDISLAENRFSATVLSKQRMYKYRPSASSNTSNGVNSPRQPSGYL